MQRESELGFPQSDDNLYVPRAHLYDFDGSNRWIAIRCPLIPTIYVSKANNRNDSDDWSIISSSLSEVAYIYELETVKSVSICKFIRLKHI